MKKIINQLMKFGVVGVLAAGIDFGLLTILIEFFNIYYLISAAVSFITATLFNYIASMRYVFISKYQDNKRKELVIYLLLTLIGLLVNQFFLWLFVENFYFHYIFSKVLSTILVMFWNFFSRKKYLE